MALSVANPIAAAVRGHRPVDSPAGDRSADRTGSDAKQAVSDQAVTDEAAGHAARYQTGRTGRIAANLVIIARTAGIMVPRACIRGDRHRGGGHRGKAHGGGDFSKCHHFMSPVHLFRLSNDCDRRLFPSAMR